MKQYQMVCQTCGKIFFSSTGRINCDECSYQGRAYRSAKELVNECVTPIKSAITLSNIKLVAQKNHCTQAQVLKNLKAMGYVHRNVYVMEKYENE